MLVPKLARIALVAVMIGGTAAGAAHAIVYNEATAGDLSNTGDTPTFFFNLAVGTHSIIGDLPDFDRDFFTLQIPNNRQLTAITLVSFGGEPNTAFLGMTFGQTIQPSSDLGDYDGYAYFGRGPHPGDLPGNVGENILDDMGMAVGAIGFTPPLPSGTYSFYVQQNDFANTTYQFDFTVATVPPTNVAGDYNGNGTVDAADYVLWRRSLNQMGANLPADGNGDQVVNNLDYDYWRQRFGNTAGSGAGLSAIAVPEPASLLLLAALTVAGLAVRPRVLRN